MRKMNWVGSLLVLTLLLVSCNKDQQLLESEVKYNNWEQLDQSDFVYEHAKHNLAYTDIRQLLPDEIGDEFMTAFQQRYDELQGLHYTDILEQLVSKGEMSSAHADMLAQAMRSIDEGIASSGTFSFDFISSHLDGLSKAAQGNSSLTLDEQKIVVLQLSVLKGACKFLGENYAQLLNENATDEFDVMFRGCTVWERTRCILFGTAIGAGLGYFIGVGVGVEAAREEGEEAMAVAGVAGGLIGGGVGGVAGFVWGVTTERCCTPDVSCYHVEGVSLRFTSCAASAEYTAFGFGPDDTSLLWVNSGGTPAMVTTPTSNPRATIAQAAADTPVRTTITSICRDNSTRVADDITMNLAILSRSVFAVALQGPDQIAPGNAYDYYGIGINSNPNYSVRWFVSGGTILSSSNATANVRWDDDGGWLQMEVTNTCTGGERRVLTLNVTGDGPIP